MCKTTQLNHIPPHTTFFKIKNIIQHTIAKIFRYQHRPHSFPFITGDGFRCLAHHIYDEKYSIDPAKVAHRDIIFVRGDLLIKFFTKIHPRIQVAYILISHNSDQHITDYYTRFIDNKILHWFGQNILCTHSKMTPIPIGIQNRIYDPNNITMTHIYKQQTYPPKKQLGIMGAFNTHTNSTRATIADLLVQNPLGTFFKKLSLSDYYTKLSSFDFCVSPEGNGFDCHRTWESLYVGTIPIVTTNAATIFWKTLGIPLFTVTSWDLLATLDTHTLYATKKSAQKHCPAMYMHYWIEKILQYTHD